MSLTSYRTAPPRVTTSAARHARNSHAGLARLHAWTMNAPRIGLDALVLVAARPSPAGLPDRCKCWHGRLPVLGPSPTGPVTITEAITPDPLASRTKSAAELPRRRCRTGLPIPRRGPYSSFLLVVNPRREYLAEPPGPGPLAGTRELPYQAHAPLLSGLDRGPASPA